MLREHVPFCYHSIKILAVHGGGCVALSSIFQQQQHKNCCFSQRRGQSQEVKFAQLGHSSFQLLEILQCESLETSSRITNISNLRVQKIHEGSFEIKENKTQNLFSILLDTPIFPEYCKPTNTCFFLHLTQYTQQ